MLIKMLKNKKCFIFKKIHRKDFLANTDLE